MARAFVIRPFGKKKDSAGKEFDFEAAHATLIGPALVEAGLAGSTTGEIIDAGNIREDMFSLILEADLVICDITILNANVFYELGIRHALRRKCTLLIKQSGSADSPPFDLLTDRYLTYSLADPAAKTKLVQSITRSAPQAAEPTKAVAAKRSNSSPSRRSTIGTFCSGKRGALESAASIRRPATAMTTRHLQPGPLPVLLTRDVTRRLFSEKAGGHRGSPLGSAGVGISSGSAAGPDGVDAGCRGHHDELLSLLRVAVPSIHGDTELVRGSGVHGVGKREGPGVVDLGHARAGHGPRRGLAVAVAHPLDVQSLGDALVAAAHDDHPVEAPGVGGAPASGRADVVDLTRQRLQ